MNYIIQRSNFTYLFFFLLVFISRVPFLSHGFGLDSNSWGVALAARNFHDKGVYEASRFPGFPIHEMLSSLTISHGYFITNLLVALISSIGVLFFVFTLKALRFKYVFLAGAVLAAVPVTYISSVITHDYSLALAFILAGLYFTVRNKPVAAGIFLGLAVGCRITSGAMLLPLSIMISQNDGVSENVKRILKMIASTIVIGVFAYLPVISQYGFSFFTYEKVPYPEFVPFLYKLFVETWGPLGVLALLLAIAVLVLPSGVSSKKFLFPRSVNEKYVVAWLIAIDLYIIAFLKLPSEAGYLLPLAPFVILIFGKYLHSGAFILFSVIMLLSPFVFSITPMNDASQVKLSGTGKVIQVSGHDFAVDFFQGPVFYYESRRIHSMSKMDSLFMKLNRLEDLSLVIAGEWYNQIQFTKNKELKNEQVIFVDYINEQSLERYYENGYELYYLPGEDKNNKLKYNFEIVGKYDAVQLSFQ